MKRVVLLIICLLLSACPVMAEDMISADTVITAESFDLSGSDETVRSAVDFDHELDTYEPLKDHYNFYFTYKTVHPWWDAVALGMEEAQRQYLEKGITITYEYLAPEGAKTKSDPEADQI